LRKKSAASKSSDKPLLVPSTSAGEGKNGAGSSSKSVDASSWVNVASKAQGAAVIFASSADKRFPPSAVIDPSAGAAADAKGATSCWLSTGMFPQEVIIQLPKIAHVFRFNIATKFVRKLTVLRCENPSMPVGWETVFDTECGESSEVQDETRTKENPVLCRYLKLRIDSGWDDFAAICHFSAEGSFVD